MKQLVENQRKELNDCRAEITSLKMCIEGSRSGRDVQVNDNDILQSQSSGHKKEETISQEVEIDSSKAGQSADASSASVDPIRTAEGDVGEHAGAQASLHFAADRESLVPKSDPQSIASETYVEKKLPSEKVAQDLLFNVESMLLCYVYLFTFGPIIMY
ncbi:hypothetical protein Dimus_034064 [Dionaea muscipula]